MRPLYRSTLHSVPLVGRGKVRDMYAIGEDKLLIITTDRLSAFDVVLSEPIPGKGRVLNQLSNFWFAKLAPIVPNHLSGITPEMVAETVVAADEIAQVAGRAVVARRLTPIPIEAVVRGYLAGSGWNDYQTTGAIGGVVLPAGLQPAQQLPEPIFTPATKANANSTPSATNAAGGGAHDENITFAQTSALVGHSVAQQIRDISIRLYREAADYALTRGIMIADTKFEFGVDQQGVLHLMDEVLTPDSSRFWAADQYQAGINPPSFDKQLVRDWLNAQSWPKTPPAPRLPAEIIEKTAEKYREALIRLTGEG